MKMILNRAWQNISGNQNLKLSWNSLFIVFPTQFMDQIVTDMFN